MANPDASFAESSDQSRRTLDELKAILLSDDRRKIALLEEKLKELENQLKNKDELLSLLDPITLNLLRKQMQTNPKEMGEILGPAIGPAIRKQIASAKDDIVDALYPVIGQAIRKAVAEAMKNLARSVNQKLDQALSFRLLRARIKAKLKGVSADEAVLSEVLPFSIHELFYIHKKSGILLAHVSAEKQDSAVKDVIGGMLTAIKNFAQDALSKEGSPQDLNVIEYDDFQIYLENGRYAFIAVVISGVPNDLFYRKIKELETQLHKRYAGLLRDFSGDMRRLEELPSELEKFLREFQRTETRSEHAPLWAKVAVSFLIIAALIIGIRYLFFPPSPPQQTITVNKTAKALQLESILDKLSDHLPASLQTDLKNLKLIVDGRVLYLQGRAANENEKVKIARVVAELSGFPVIVNELTLSNPQKTVVEKINKTRIYFQKESSRILPNEKKKIHSLIPLFQQISDQKIRLIGHSDSLGSDLLNLNISQKRAEAVRQLLIENGIEQNRIEVVAKGRKEPLVSNRSEKERALNRCVVFKVLENTSDAGTRAH